MIMHRRYGILAMAVSILGVAGLAFARGDAMPESPPKPGDYASMGMGIVYAMAFLGAICVLGFKVSRRTHMDY
jgi:hypothetical protein